jgi:hypothetical protein
MGFEALAVVFQARDKKGKPQNDAKKELVHFWQQCHWNDNEEIG